MKAYFAMIMYVWGHRKHIFVGYFYVFLALYIVHALDDDVFLWFRVRAPKTGL